MQSFDYCVPTKIIFGRKAEEKTGATLKSMGFSRVFIVFGGGSVKRSGLLDRVEKTLDENGITYEEFGGAVPNPLLEHAREGIKKAVEFKADFILAVGGGSAIDTAKGIAHGCANPDIDIWKIWTKEVPLEKSMPIGSVLTIPAAGSESSNSAVLTNSREELKVGLGTPFNIPCVAFMNPELTYTLPQRQIINGIVDIMMHTLDRYFASNGENELTDGIAQALLKTVIKNGEKAVQNHEDYDVMSELMWCSSISHNGLTGLGRPHDFSVHALGKQLSALYNCDHGATLSAVWGSWARYVCESAPDRFLSYAKGVWNITETNDKKAVLAGIEATENFFRKIGAPVSIPELGISVGDDELVRIADDITKKGSATCGAVIRMTKEDVINILESAN